MTLKRWHAGSAFANTFRDLRDHSNTTLLTAGLLLIPSLGTTFLESYLGSRLVSLIALPATLALGVWLQASLIKATHGYATGSDPGVGRLLSSSSDLRRLVSLFGVQAILFLLGLGVVIVSFAPVFGVGVAGLAASGGDFNRMMSGGLVALLIISLIFGLALLAFLGLVLALRYGLAAAVNVIEKRPAPDSLSRSRSMMRGRWLDLILVYLMLVGTVIAGAVALLLPATIVAGSTASAQSVFPTDFQLGDFFRTPQFPVGASAIVALSSYLHGILVSVITIGALTNFYLAIRGEEAMDASSPEPNEP